MIAMYAAALILAAQLWQGWFVGECPSSPKLRECAPGRPCRTDFVQTYPGICGMRGDDAQEFGARTLVATTFDAAVEYAAAHGLDTLETETGPVQLDAVWFAGE